MEDFRAGAVPIEFPIGGVTYIFSPLGIEDFQAAQQHLAMQRRNPLAVVAEVYGLFPPEVAERMRKEAYQDAKAGEQISIAAVFAWLNTIDGCCFSVWKSLVQKHPATTLADAIALFESMTADEQKALIDRIGMISGTDELGNLIGQLGEAGVARATFPLGEKSTASSPTSMAGVQL